MKNITKWSFRNKAAMIVVVVLTLGLGAISYLTLPMEFLPEADNPQVTIATLGQGHDAQSMVQSVTNPIEDAVSTVKGKTEIYSTTGDGYSKVNIFFDSGTNMDDAKQAVQEALGTLRFPEGVSKPNVIQLNTSMIPVSQVSLSFESGLTKENIETVESDLLPMFQDIDGVANVALYGKTDPRVIISLNKDKMEELRIPIQSVMGVLQGQNLAVSVGEEAIDGQKSNLKVIGNVSDLEQLGNLTLPSQVPNGPSVQLDEIATIEKKVEQESVMRINGEEALALMVTKNGNSSAVTVGEKVEKTVAALNESRDNVHAEVVYATSDMISDSVNSMLREVLLGALFATIVIVFFLRNIRSTLITIVSIPLSLGLTLFLLWQSGITLNILTLGGVAVAVGRLVDDSIVVVENIFRRTQSGSFTKENIIEATGEVGKAITSSTLTTIAVFLPMGLIEGSLRQFLLPFALTVTYSLLASLLVALTVVPIMSARLLKSSKLPKHREPKRYKKALTWSLNHKWVPIVAATLVFFGSVALYIFMPKGAISAKDATMVSVTMKYSSDTPIAEVKEKAADLEETILAFDGYKYVLTEQGNSADAAQWGQVKSPTEATFTVIMDDGADAEAFIEKIEEEKSNYPQADITAGTSSLMSASSSVITFDLIGENEQDLIDASRQLMADIEEVDGVNKVSSNQEEKKPVYSIEINADKANAGQVASQLHTLLNPTPIGTVNLDGKDTTVYVDAGVDPTSDEDLNQLQVATAAGTVSLSSIASIEKEVKTSTVLHKGGDQYLRVSASVDPEKLSVVGAAINAKISDLDLPDGVTLEKGGAVAQQASDFADLGITMLASIGIVYLIMVITFKTLRAPIAILMTLPLASIGAVLGLLVTQVPVDPTALFGALMLIGIVVTNAIVLIDRVKQNEEHMSIREAIIEGAATRMRPILMTAIATICAMLPLLFTHAGAGSLVSKSLAVVVIGGLAAATVLTLIIVPVFYELLYFRKSKKQRLELQDSMGVQR